MSAHGRPMRKRVVARILLASLFAAFAVVAPGCSSADRGPVERFVAEPGLARLEPDSGTYLGVGLDWANDTAAGFNGRLGAHAAVYVGFFEFPLREQDIPNLEGLAQQAGQQGGAALVTLEPAGGLDDVTPEAAADLAARLAAFNADGVPVFVRFAHEMNGSWYPWSQQPDAYREAFVIVAEAVHAAAPLSAMLWAPNYGGGYPFIGGRYQAQPGTAAFAALDTNGDGKLDMSDDMYAPYYPGDDAVDWVGMSLYHWGDAYPWGENEIPESRKFVDQLTGMYDGKNGDERSVPDFYATYADGHGKPVAIPETAALFVAGREDGASEFEIKQAWWRQVFSAEVAREYPALKLINWFEWRKFEVEINGVIDWRLTVSPALVEAFFSDLDAHLFRFAPLD